MEVVNITDLTRRPKQVLDKVSDKNDVVIIHRQKKPDVVLISLDEWNRLNKNKDDYLHGYADETEYLLSNPANKKHLLESIEQGKKGETTIVDLDDIWKDK